MSNKTYDNSVWALKYRPTSVDGLILSSAVKTQLTNIIKDDKISNMLFSGPPGNGKTSSALILAAQLERESIYINGSASGENGIGIIQSRLQQFVTSCSWNGNKKIVIIDESDNMTNALQSALKIFLEENSKACNFIFISNHKNKIIPPLQSRLQYINFNITGPEQNELKKDFYRSCVKILNAENVEFDKNVVGYVVCQHFPDMRKTLTELQKFSQQGKLLDLESIKTITEDLATFFNLLKEKNFSQLRKYTANITDPQRFYSQLGEECLKYVESSSIVEFCLLLSKYSYESAFIVDAQVNVTGFFCDCISTGVKIKNGSSI